MMFKGGSFPLASARVALRATGWLCPEGGSRTAPIRYGPYRPPSVGRPPASRSSATPLFIGAETLGVYSRFGNFGHRREPGTARRAPTNVWKRWMRIL